MFNRIKKKYYRYITKYLFKEIKSDKFPQRGVGYIKTKIGLQNTKKYWGKTDISHNLGCLYNLPHPISVEAYKIFLDQNPQHLGNWSIRQQKTERTYNIEKQVILKMIDLYKANKNNYEGYVTTGGTESNLYSLWIGRNYLKQFFPKNKLCLIRSDLTHYSVRKSSNIVDVDEFTTPLNSVDWNIDPEGLSNKIKLLYKNGFRGFLIPLTIGYTLTGSSDNIEKIVKIIQKTKKKLRGSCFFIWIDASFNGLVEPFTVNNFEPLKSSMIKTFLVDFHKFGLVPYPAGIVLYRKELRKIIEEKIDYLPEKDSTILGSRSGLPSIAIWAVINCLGRNNYSILVKKQLANKEYFLEKFVKRFPTTTVISNPKSLSCGIMFNFLKNKRIPISIEKKYGLFLTKTRLSFYPNKTAYYKIYKFYFQPHITRKTINEFLFDIDNIFND